MPELQPMLARSRYCDEEWEYASSGSCDRELECGIYPGRIVRCGQPSSPNSFYRWCDEHDRDARDENPAAYGK
ncbi:hypothetical protein ACIA5D_36675 [Actinoplanes sp. NPDC051513]|uniref:hypothetical protein n=1 Tax=Actinoplanes sp. NPDC051513 TaxID=3363908 RepID=UPI00379CEC78